MAIVTMRLPLCDRCGAVTLPSEKLPDGSLNPAREHPELHKRCGTCKSPLWNYKATEKEAQKPEPKHQAHHRTRRAR
jgi:hypothetical protein